MWHIVTFICNIYVFSTWDISCVAQAAEYIRGRDVIEVWIQWEELVLYLHASRIY